MFDGAIQSFTLLSELEDAYAEQGRDEPPRDGYGPGSQSAPDICTAANGEPRVLLLPGDVFSDRLLDSDD
jgi:hypothetical protein